MDAPVFADDVPNPHSTGYAAAQNAGVDPTASTAPKGRWMAKVVAAQQAASAPPAPEAPANEEPSWAPEDSATTAAEGAIRSSNRGVVPTVPVATAQQRDAEATAARQASLEKTAGEKVDTASGLQDPGLRFTLSTINNSADRAKFLSDKGYPAKVVNNNGQDMVIFRDPTDGSMKTIRGSGSIGAGDVAGAGPDVLRAAIQIGLIPLTDGGPLLLKMVHQAGAAGGEKMLEGAVNRIRGYNSQSVGADAGGAARTGASAALAEAVGSALQSGSNAAVNKNSGLFNPSDAGKAVLEAQERLKAFDPNVRGVTPAAVAGGVVGARERQLAAMANPLQNTYGQIRQGIASLFQKSIQDLTGGAAPAIGDQPATVNNVLYPGLNDVVAGMQKDAAAPLAAVPAVSPTVGGRALQQGAQELPEKLSSRIADKFTKAFTAGSNAPESPNGVVNFDLSNLNKTGADITRGKLGQGIPKEVTSTEEKLPAEGFGVPVSTTSTSIEPTQVKVGGATPEIQAIIDKIKQLNPTLGQGPVVPGTDSPYDVLKLLNTKIGSAAEFPGPGASTEAKATQGQAKKLFGVMQDTLQNPAEGAPADFVPKMKAASNATAFRSKVLDTPDMQEAMRTMSPEDLMAKADPSNPTFIKTAKRVMDPKKFATFQDAYFTSLTKEPEKLQAFMAAQRADPTVANMMLTPERKQLLSDYSGAMEKIQGSPAQKMLENKNFSARPAQALDSGDAASVADIINRGGGPNSPIGQNMRAAVFQRALEGATSEGKVDFGKAANSIEAILKTKDGKTLAQSILTPEELQRLTDVQTVASAMNKHTGSGDVGTSLKTSGVASHFGLMQSVVHPVKAVEALGDILESWMQSHLWKSEAARQALVGTGPRTGAPARAAGAAIMNYENSGQGQEPRIGGN